jgi:hypothetical protein
MFLRTVCRLLQLLLFLYNTPTSCHTINPQLRCTAKMVRSQGVEAYLVRYEDKYRYPEHEPLRASNEASDPTTMAYVEVSTGERYEIIVVLTAGFDFKDCPAVRVSWKSDNDPGRRTVCSAHNVQRAIRSEGRLEQKFSARPLLVDGNWMNHGLSFADLQIGTSPYT